MRFTASHVRAESFHGSDEIRVFDIPKRKAGFVLGKHTDRRDQLSEAQLRTSGANLGELLENMTE
jgi:hypothetical protein